MVDIQKVYEDAVVGAGEGAAAADVQSASDPASTLNAGFMKPSDSKIGDTDVLGKCDHNKECGYMKDGCFHLPAGAKPKVMHREILAGKKKKNHKNDYIKNMEVLVSEAELDRDTILAVHNVPEEEIVKFVQSYDSNAQEIVSIAYYPAAKKFFLKFSNGKDIRYIMAEFDGKKFIDNPDFIEKKIWTKDDVKIMYDWTKTKEKVWVIWGAA